MVAQYEATSTIVQRVRDFAPRIVEAGPEIERIRRLPQSLIDGLTDLGVFKLLVPRSLGGSELPLPIYIQVVEEIAKADGSTAWCVSQGAVAALASGFLPEAGAREVFSAHDARIASGAGTPGVAVKVDGGYRVTGRWPFGSGSRHSTWLAGGCVLKSESGEALLDEHGRTRTWTAYFPTSVAEFEDIWHVSGLRGTASDLYAVTDLFVPEQRSAGLPWGNPREDGPLYQLPGEGFTCVHACGFASVALGLARPMLDAFVDMAVTKVPRGATGVLRENAVIQTNVAQCQAILDSARLYLHQVVADAWEGAERHDLTLDQRIRVRLATTFAIQRAMQVADTIFHAAGATAIFTSHPYERRFRDIHAVSQQIQGRSEHFETVGQYMMGLEPARTWL